MQILADSNDPRGFYQIQGAVLGSVVNHPEQPLALDNKTIMTVKRELFAKLSDHFATLLHKWSTVEQNAVNNIEQRTT